jgi:2-polyprenyl-6-methoxyphenol hydroxylase-like FAD-dependent oxidoreductase
LFDAVKSRQGDGRVLTGLRFESVDGKSPVTAVFRNENGMTGWEECDLLIGADGIHLALRHLRDPDEGLLASDGHQTINRTAGLTQPQMPDRETWSKPGSKADFAASFADWYRGWPVCPS